MTFLIEMISTVKTDSNKSFEQDDYRPVLVKINRMTAAMGYS